MIKSRNHYTNLRIITADENSKKGINNYIEWYLYLFWMIEHNQFFLLLHNILIWFKYENFIKVQIMNN